MWFGLFGKVNFWLGPLRGECVRLCREWMFRDDLELRYRRALKYYKLELRNFVELRWLFRFLNLLKAWRDTLNLFDLHFFRKMLTIKPYLIEEPDLIDHYLIKSLCSIKDSYLISLKVIGD